MMSATEAKITIRHGISVTLSDRMNAKSLTLRKPSGDQREGDHRFICDLEEWALIVRAVQKLQDMMVPDEA